MHERTVKLTNEEATIVILALEAFTPALRFGANESDKAVQRRMRSKAIDIANRVRVA